MGLDIIMERDRVCSGYTCIFLALDLELLFLYLSPVPLSLLMVLLRLGQDYCNSFTHP